MSKCAKKIRFYTIELVFKAFVDPSVSYGKIIDFNNRTKDDGVYLFYSEPDAFLTYSPGGGAGKTPLNKNEYNQVIITRNTAEKVTIYLNKIKQFEFYDYEKSAVIETENLSFFTDDIISNNENYKFLVSKINIYSKPMTSSQIMDLDVFHGVVNPCPTGIPEPTYPPLPTPTPEVCIIDIENIPSKLYVYKDCEPSTSFVCSSGAPVYYLESNTIVDDETFIP